MKIILPGGSGQVGTILARHLHAQGHDVLVLSRTPTEQQTSAPWRTAYWDALTINSKWASELEGADAVIHLSGRTVNCRYTPENRRQIYDSRIIPTRLLGEVIAATHNPPRIWMNASTSTIYRHALDRPQDEFTGELGRRTSGPPTAEQVDLPETWSFSCDVAHKWEKHFTQFPRPTPARSPCVRRWL